MMCERIKAVYCFASQAPTELVTLEEIKKKTNSELMAPKNDAESGRDFESGWSQTTSAQNRTNIT